MIRLGHTEKACGRLPSSLCFLVVWNAELMGLVGHPGNWRLIEVDKNTKEIRNTMNPTVMMIHTDIQTTLISNPVRTYSFAVPILLAPSSFLAASASNIFNPLSSSLKCASSLKYSTLSRYISAFISP
jgi:hypothetical protein